MKHDATVCDACTLLLRNPRQSHEECHECEIFGVGVRWGYHVDEEQPREPQEADMVNSPHNPTVAQAGEEVNCPDRYYPEHKRRLTVAQDQCLYDILRSLEFRNAYEQADQLKLAFRIELDNLRGGR